MTLRRRACGHPEYAVGLRVWQHRVICRLANAEAARDNIGQLVEAKTTIQAIVEREWSTTVGRAADRSWRWLDQPGGPGALASAKQAAQALELATQRLASSKRGAAQLGPIPALPFAAAPADTRRPIRRQLLTARATFEVVYTQDNGDAADR